MYSLFLDDERQPKSVTWVKLPLVDWVIVRNYDEFVKVVTERGLPNVVSFDHDLSFEHYPFNANDVGEMRNIPYQIYNEKTGYHVVKWLIEYCRERTLKFPTYYVHSMNPVGRANIRNAIEDYIRQCGQNLI
jgi:hypothetical protein